MSAFDHLSFARKPILFTRRTRYCLFSSYLLLLLLFSSPRHCRSVGPNFYGLSCRKVYIKSPKTRLIDQRLYDYCRATRTHVQNSGGTPWFTTFIIYMCPTSWNSTDDFGFAECVHSDAIYIYIKYVTLYILYCRQAVRLCRESFSSSRTLNAAIINTSAGRFPVSAMRPSS